MEYLAADLAALPRVLLLNTETLSQSVSHKSRTAREYILYYMLSGTLHLNDNGREVTLLPGDLYLFFKGEYHCPVEATDCHYIYLHFDGDYTVEEHEGGEAQALFKAKHNAFLLSSCFSAEFDTRLLLPKRWRVTDPALHKKILQTEKSHRLSASSPKTDFYRTGAALAVTRLFLDIYRAHAGEIAGRAQTPGERLAKEIVTYLGAHYGEKITGDLLQKEFGYQFDYLNRCFKKVTGKTVFRYLQEERVKNAAHLLRLKNITVTQAARQCGFCDVYHFSKTFRQIEGCPPGKFAREGRVES